VLEGEALPVAAARDDPAPPAVSVPAAVSLMFPAAVPDDFPSLRVGEFDSIPEDSGAVRACRIVPGTTLDEPKPFSERSADCGADPVSEPPRSEVAPLSFIVVPTLGRLGAASPRA
jgi:hypothetical protein